MACTDPDGELWCSASHGCMEAFTQLREVHQTLVRSQLWKRCPSLGHSDLKDLEQEVWIAVWTALPRFQGDSSFDTWLVSVAKNVLCAWLRRQHRAELKLMRFYSAGGAETGEVVKGDALNRLSANEAINRLSEPEHRVIELRYFHQFTDKEIASRLHIPLGTVKGRIRSGLIHLRKSW